MTDELDAGQKQALEACVYDTASFLLLFKEIQQHPQSALLFLGIMPSASMYVVESYRCLVTLFPEFEGIFASDYADLLRASRRRAKLLDDSRKSIDDVAKELVAIAEQNNDDLFLNLIVAFLLRSRRLCSVIWAFLLMMGIYSLQLILLSSVLVKAVTLKQAPLLSEKQLAPIRLVFLNCFGLKCHLALQLQDYLEPLRCAILSMRLCTIVDHLAQFKWSMQLDYLTYSLH